MIRRESTLFSVLGDAFKQVFPDDILELTYEECSADCAKFLITYETTFKDSIYYDTKEKSLPEADRTYHPGILLNWKFRVGLPSENKPYKFELESIPAETVSYEGAPVQDHLSGVSATDGTNIERNNFYDAMVTSAFDDFRQHLVFKLGIGPPPKDIDAGDGEVTSERNGAKSAKGVSIVR
jgi:hypothetical protein